MAKRRKTEDNNLNDIDNAAKKPRKGTVSLLDICEQHRCEKFLLEKLKEALDDCESDEERKEMVNAVDDRSHQSILHWIVYRGYRTVFQAIVSKDGALRKAGFDNFFATTCRVRMTALHEACLVNNSEFVRSLVTDGCKDDVEREKMVNMLDDDGLSILDMALVCIGDHTLVIDEIMDPDGIIRKSGFNRFYQVNNKTTLYYAARDPDNFRCLYNHLKNGVMDLEQLVDALCAVDDDGETILHCWSHCADNNQEIFTGIVECFDRVSQDPSLSESSKEEMKARLRELPFRKTNEGKSALAILQSTTRLRAILELLMKNDEIFSKESIRDLVNAVDNRGRTLLFGLYSEQGAEFVEELILRSGKEAGFDSILAVDVDGNTVLQASSSIEAMIAILKGCRDKEERIKLLRSKNHQGKTFFHTTRADGFISRVLPLIDDDISLFRSMLMTMDNDGNIPLHNLTYDTMDMMEAYDRCGILSVAVNFQNKHGLTPLHKEVAKVRWFREANACEMLFSESPTSSSSNGTNRGKKDQRIPRMDVDPNIATTSRIVFGE